MNYEHCSTAFDSDFNGITELKWLPWVGQCFSEQPRDARLLIVGESHYDWPEEGGRKMLSKRLTRCVVSEPRDRPERLMSESYL